MSDKVTVQSVIGELKAHKGNLCCADVTRLLESLGFEVRDGKRGGHKIYVHDGLAEFRSGSFNCGHGKNPEIKPAYITKIVSVLKANSDELEKFLKESS